MNKENLKAGIFNEESFIVEKRHLASEVGSGLVSVFSTAMMIAAMESAAVQAVQPYLSEGLTTVGVHVDVYHRAATSIGMKVHFKATLLEISPNGKGFKFKVEAWDENGLIGDGLHERVVVNKEQFELKSREKGRK